MTAALGYTLGWIPTVADPGFPRGVGANSQGGRQPLILSIFAENCMKMKKFWLPGGGGGASPAPPLDQPLPYGALNLVCSRQLVLDRKWADTVIKKNTRREENAKHVIILKEKELFNVTIDCKTDQRE